MPNWAIQNCDMEICEVKQSGSSTKIFFSVIDYFPGKVHHYMLEKSRVVHQEKVFKRKFIINDEQKMITL